MSKQVIYIVYVLIKLLIDVCAIFFVSLFREQERERERVSWGGADRERERENPRQAPLSVWSPMWGSNPEL